MIREECPFSLPFCNTSSILWAVANKELIKRMTGAECNIRYSPSFNSNGTILRELRLHFGSEKEMWDFYDNIEDRGRITYINRESFIMDLDAARLTVKEYREETQGVRE